MKQLEYVVRSLVALQLVACGNVMRSQTESSNVASAGQPSAAPVSSATAGRDANAARAVAAASTSPSRPASAAVGGMAGAVASSAPASSAAGMAPTQVAAGAPAAAGAAAATDPNTCDRACLLDFMKSYQDALIAKDPSKLKVASNL